MAAKRGYPGLALMLAELPVDVRSVLKAGRYSAEQQGFFCLGFARAKSIYEQRGAPIGSQSQAPQAPTIQVQTTQQPRTISLADVPGDGGSIDDEGLVDELPSPSLAVGPLEGMSEQALEQCTQFTRAAVTDDYADVADQIVLSSAAGWVAGGYTVPPSSWKAEIARKLQEYEAQQGVEMLRKKPKGAGDGDSN